MASSRHRRVKSWSCGCGQECTRCVSSPRIRKASGRSRVWVDVSVPEPNQRVPAIRTLFGDDVIIKPGTVGAIPIGAYVLDLQTSKVTAELSIRERRSGTGTGRAQLQPVVTLSQELVASGAKVSASATPDGLALKLEISWDPSKPKTGRIDLGSLTVNVPASVALGEQFHAQRAGDRGTTSELTGDRGLVERSARAGQCVGWSRTLSGQDPVRGHGRGGQAKPPPTSSSKAFPPALQTSAGG